MLQTFVVYGIVAASGLWVTWSILLPKPWRQRLRMALPGGASQNQTPEECGSGGCGKCGH